jgi:hypothetical protein
MYKKLGEILQGQGLNLLVKQRAWYTGDLIFLTILLTYLFPPIDRAIPEGAFTYPGKSPREVIVVDLENSPLLERACKDVEASVEREILASVLRLVRNDLFDLKRCDENALWNFMLDQPSFPNIALDVFLKAKRGVCRHFALVTTYLVEHLIRKGKLKGEAFLIREDTPMGRHAWTLFLSEHGAWHLDAYWNVLENGKTDAGFSALCHKYGKRQIQKYSIHE